VRYSKRMKAERSAGGSKKQALIVRSTGQIRLRTAERHTGRRRSRRYAMEYRPGRGTDQPAEDDQAPNVWSGWLPIAPRPSSPDFHAVVPKHRARPIDRIKSAEEPNSDYRNHQLRVIQVSPTAVSTTTGQAVQLRYDASAMYLGQTIRDENGAVLVSQNDWRFVPAGMLAGTAVVPQGISGWPAGL
jgi:hypothetical protein